MCGRFAQYRPPLAYADAIGWRRDQVVIDESKRAPAWNVAPGTQPWLMHLFSPDAAALETVNWGYRPEWAAERDFPLSINARIEKAATGAYFRGLFKSGRVIVPADGWYEWTGEPRNKQPWYIRLKSKRPLFMAALTNFRPGKTVQQGTGFVIVTAAAEGGLVDVHDRRPVVLRPDDARMWMNPEMPAVQAEQLARSMSLPAGVFEWYQVSKDVNKANNNEAHLIAPLAF
jgi:putative SOS response-associated peptidase YedK